MTTTATRHVGNSSTAPIFLAGYGLLDTDDARRAELADGADLELVEVPDTPQVHELLGNGALWTQEQENPEGGGTADPTPKKAAKRAPKED